MIFRSGDCDHHSRTFHFWHLSTVWTVLRVIVLLEYSTPTSTLWLLLEHYPEELGWIHPTLSFNKGLFSSHRLTAWWYLYQIWQWVAGVFLRKGCSSSAMQSLSSPQSKAQWIWFELLHTITDSDAWAQKGLLTHQSAIQMFFEQIVLQMHHL